LERGIASIGGDVCAVSAAGALTCRAVSPPNSPALVNVPHGVKEVSARFAGAGQPCAIFTPAGVKRYIGAHSNDPARWVAIPRLKTGAVSLSTMSIDFGCALMTNHTVKCWASLGPLVGDGKKHRRPVRVPVSVAAP
jgi:hypothetical protein